MTSRLRSIADGVAWVVWAVFVWWATTDLIYRLAPGGVFRWE